MEPGQLKVCKDTRKEVTSRIKLKKKKKSLAVMCVNGGGLGRWDPSSVNLLRQMGPAERAAPSWEKSQSIASSLHSYILSLQLFMFNLKYILLTSFRVPSAGALS
jgi:hypothetical protein